MTRKPLLLLLLLAVALGSTGCVHHAYDRVRWGSNPYERDPFYMRYATSDTPLDFEIRSTVAALRANPGSAWHHNRLGALLAQKGFPKDAEREFTRAIAADPNVYQAWYNLGLIREYRGNVAGAQRAFRRTVDIKRGHPAAHFQLGLLLERAGKRREAIEHYARAFAINESLLEVRVNPRILDTRLAGDALLLLYPSEHARRSMLFQRLPRDYGMTNGPAPAPPAYDAPSPDRDPADIVTPSPPPTDPGRREPAPQPPGR
jgi:tetratricopeptide (TPR) repeat protein